MFTEKDINQIEKQGLTINEVESQVERFKKGFPFLKLEKPATVDDGIIRLNNDEVRAFAKLYDDSKPDALKFVPASGAASRMFKFLFEFYSQARDQYRSLGDVDNEEARVFFRNIEKFAFYSELKATLQNRGFDLNELLEKGNYKTILEYLLTDSGMNYGAKPKAVLAFHSSGQHIRTAFEEHLTEGAAYTKNAGSKVKIHFTISPEHETMFDELLQKVKQDYERMFDVQFEITYSKQKPSTDTIAVDLHNKLFRNPDGTLLFRPGGHGALIENLNELDSSIIFIKNIDNVVPDRLNAETMKYKKALAGILLSTREKIYHYLEKIESDDVSDRLIEELEDFIQNELCYRIHPDSTSNKTKIFYDILNRPLRVCGMVKNEGEPGGGPFWVKHPDYHADLQIVETSQINRDDPGQMEILNQSTHFNPVDLVCSVKNFRGEHFDLLQYTDPDTGFISQKSKDGKELKALELPGLWNGAMAKWNTVFVEVPVTTFNPVKTVNDLLRPGHK
ncbi:MAG: DUF4301 family protein [Bacteroidales bacterium]|nr:DUF4301 family protein [Bacteroidales bacterium]